MSEPAHTRNSPDRAKIKPGLGNKEHDQANPYLINIVPPEQGGTKDIAGYSEQFHEYKTVVTSLDPYCIDKAKQRYNRY
jgi:hypothetical protein